VLGSIAQNLGPEAVPLGRQSERAQVEDGVASLALPAHATVTEASFELEKPPTQKFHANWAYLLMRQIAFNLVAWFKRLVLPPGYRRATIKTIRPHLLNLAGKIVHTARRRFLVISECYRYQSVWQFAMKRLAILQFA